MFQKHKLNTKNLFFIFLLSVLVFLVILAVFSPFFAPYDPYMTSLAKKLLPANPEHLLGTDHLGRDVFSRLIYGLRISLVSVLLISFCIVLFALIVGSIAGYKGGLFDSILMRICDVFLTFPTFILALFFIGVLGVGLFNVIITIILTHWAWYARIVRSLVLELKSQGYVLAAKSTGSSDFKIIIRHIIPSVLVQIVILATLDFGHMLLHVAGLSFLGLGIQAPTAEWGVMISDAIPYIRENPELMLYPGFCIFIIVALFNSLGEVLRDKLDTQAHDTQVCKTQANNTQTNNMQANEMQANEMQINDRQTYDTEAHHARAYSANTEERIHNKNTRFELGKIENTSAIYETSVIAYSENVNPLCAKKD